MGVNPIYAAIEDAVISSLETDNGVFLPDDFTVTIDDPAFQVLLKGLVFTNTQKPVPPTLKRILLEIQGRKVTVRSELDPEPWLPLPIAEALH